jgi:hypothetical protein
MNKENGVISLGEKIRLLAQDIYDAAVLKNSLKLENYVPSKQIQNLVDQGELDSLITYLRKQGILTYTYRRVSTAANFLGAPKSENSLQPYEIIISQPNMRRLLGLKESPNKPVEKGIKLHTEFSYLIVNGEEIPLAKGKLHRSLQYWICWLCLKAPNTPVQETDIMEQYAPDYEITARNRAVRDAVYKLNPKLKKATGIDELFTYSNGYVVFNANKLK